MNEASSKKQFFSGLTALTLSGLAVKVIGLLCKIPLFHILGDVGMGYYNSAYELYTLFFVISTSGLPVALSIMVSENIAGGRLRNTKRIIRITGIIFLIVGLCGSLIMAFGAQTFAGFLGNPNAKFCILVISPTIFFICVSSVQRGYFQGCGNMVPTSVSQVIEAFSKLIFGMALAFFAVNAGKDSPVSSAYAVVGLAVGTGLSMVYLILTKNHHEMIYNYNDEPRTDGYFAIVKKLFLLALPVTLSSSLSSLSRVADMAILQRRLVDIGLDMTSATAIYGSYSTLALPIYNLPMTLITAISVSLVPLLASAVESRSREKAVSFIQTALRLCALIAVPCSFGISVFSKQILGLVFKGEYEAISVAAPCLSVLGLSVFASCLLTVTNAVLQAYHKAFLPTISMAVGCIVKVICAYILIGIPGIGALGAAISTLVCNLLAVAVNLRYIDRYTDYSGNIAKTCISPILSSIISVFFAIVLYFFITSVGANDAVALLASIMLCVVVYVIVSLKKDTVLCDDIEMLPGGDKMLKLLTKLRIINNKKDTNNEQRRKNGKAVAEGKL